MRALSTAGHLEADFATEGREALAKGCGLEGRRQSLAEEEQSGWALEIVGVSGVPRATTIGAEFIGSYEMKRLRELAKSIGGFLDGPYVVTRNGDSERHYTLTAVVDAIYESAKRGLVINRYKGLGEMNPEQLWETTMNPETRRLLQVAIEDGVEANEVFSILMGDAVEPRREFIEKKCAERRTRFCAPHAVIPRS